MRTKEIEALFKLAFRAGYDQARVENMNSDALDAVKKKAYKAGQIAEAERNGDRKRALDLQGGLSE